MGYKEKLIERLVQRIQNGNTELLEIVGRALKKIGTLKASDIHEIQQQLKYGENLEKIVKILSNMSNMTQKEIFDIFEKVAETDLNFAKIYYEAKNKTFIPYEQNEPLKMMVEEIARATQELLGNIATTSGWTYLDANGNKVTDTVINAYWQIIDDSIMNIRTGKETFNQALRKQIKTLGSSGIKKIEYESGATRRLDSALRMNMQDGLQQMAVQQQKIVGEQFGYDAMEVSVHEYPAPDHEDIQGRVFDLDNWSKLQDYEYYGVFEDVNNRVYTRDTNNHIRAIATLNCKHIGIATFKDVKPRYTEDELRAINKRNHEGFEFEGEKYSYYEGTQLQRRIETKIREEKDLQILARQSGDDEEAQLHQKKINQLTSKYNDLSKASNLPVYKEKMQVSGYRKIKVD